MNLYELVTVMDQGQTSNGVMHALICCYCMTMLGSSLEIRSNTALLLFIDFQSFRLLGMHVLINGYNQIVTMIPIVCKECFHP